MALFACIIEKHIKEIEWRYPEVVTVWGKKKPNTSWTTIGDTVHNKCNCLAGKSGDNVSEAFKVPHFLYSFICPWTSRLLPCPGYRLAVLWWTLPHICLFEFIFHRLYSRLQSMGSWRVGHDWATSLSLFTFIHWGRKWQPTPVFLPGDSQGRGSLVGCRLWGCTELDTTEAT